MNISIIPDNGIQFTFPLHYADSLPAKRIDSLRGPLANWCAQNVLIEIDDGATRGHPTC
ncbi:hypothetical protein QA649_05060 [Bradyrhizobium sp. CB1717]|uniref:hypothetical protein n=1 Tax=Bradyrhizobium sp. CB1717 TaxID=3039154 RepID=UPI0024B247D8|nr:hypothetical protein [Bradyrhizobium sp. CB1717]WFU25582.1 hypothetical protein QA649_05060 [Bradyrhizobium sp. CB1717]